MSDISKMIRDEALNADMDWTGIYQISPDLAFAAADRIEKLEAAMREIAAGYETEWSTSTMGNMLDVAQILSERINIARKALEGKDE
jgi:hypothetical protein